VEHNTENQIKEWLNKTGYPLELKVASIFRKHGFQVDKSFYYLDRTSNDTREIDVIAFYDEYRKGYLFRFFIVTECKTLVDKSVLAFTDNAEKTNRILNSFLKANIKGQKLLKHVNFRNENFQGIRFEDKIANALRICPIVESKKSVNNPEKQNKDLIYEAYRQVTKASEYLLNFFEEPNNQFSDDTVIIIFPFIVIDGEMYECYHQNFDENFMIHSINNVKYLTHNPVSKVKMDLIDVISIHIKR
jgi:hypothetical protein